MKVLFVNGPSQDSCDRFFGWPTSLLYAMAPTVEAVKRGDLEADLILPVFDPVWCIPGINDAAIKSAFLEQAADADVICASCTYDSLHPTLELLRAAKNARGASVVTVLGGPHLDEIRECPQLGEVTGKDSVVDIAVAGDGEYALLHILKNASRNRGLLSGIEKARGNAVVWHKGKDVLARTSGRSLHLDSLPFLPVEYAADRHSHDFDIFRSDDGNVLTTVQMIAQRGCAYGCSFCSESSRLSKPNARSVDSLREEIALRQSAGFGAVFFDDSTFGAYRHLTELLSALRGTGLQYGCLNRFSHLQEPRVLDKYREAGFVYCYCAIEQFDDIVLRHMHKRTTTAIIEKAMKNLRDCGMALGVSVLYGVPYETTKSIEATLDFVTKWVDEGVIKMVSESVLSLHPGTPEGASLVSGFDRTPPNQGMPFSRFEEGQWYHLGTVTPAYLERIASLSQERFGSVLVRNRHSWYRKQGLVTPLPKEQHSRRMARR